MNNNLSFKIETPISNHQCFKFFEEQEESKLNMFFFSKKYCHFYEDSLDVFGLVISIECLFNQKNKIKIINTSNVNKYIKENDFDFYLVFLHEELSNNVSELILEDMIDFFSKTKKYILLNGDRVNIKQENYKEKDLKYAYVLKEKIYNYISFLSVLNLECIDIKQEVKEKKQIIPKDCFLEKPNFVGKNKIVGWTHGTFYDYECGTLKNVVYSFYSIFFKNNEKYVYEYIVNESNKYKYPIFVNKEDFEKFDNQKAYNYKKLKDSDVYLYVRMNSVIFVNHAIKMLKDNNIDIEDFFVLIKKTKK